MIPSLWPVIHHLANGEAWPPASEESAARFVARANQEALLPLLAAEGDLPAVVHEAVRRSAALISANAARSRMINAAFRHATELLGGERFIVLKGCDFAHRLYARPEFRPMADIDVLVREGEMDRVTRALLERGLTRAYPSGLASRVPWYHESVLAIDSVTFEVHHRFVPKTQHRIDYSAIFDRAMPFEKDGVMLLRLSTEDAFAYETLSIGIKYFTSPLIRYVDLWLMLKNSPGVVAAAAQRASEWRTERLFYAAMRYGARLFPEYQELSPWFQNVVPARVAKILDEHVIPQVAAGPKRVPPRARQLVLKILLHDRLTDAGAYAAEYAASSVWGALDAGMRLVGRRFFRSSRLRRVSP